MCNTGHEFDVTSESGSSWRLIIDFVYRILPKQSAITTVDQPKLRFQEEFSQLLDSGKQSDVTFVVQGEMIKAHKLVLTTRCKHFETMFDSGMSETFSNKIEINDIKPKTFKEFLRFLYTFVAPKYKNKDSTMELLAAADKYCVDDLKMICEKAINSNLHCNNVIDALIMAEKHNCPTMLTAAKAVFEWHTKGIVKGLTPINPLLSLARNGARVVKELATDAPYNRETYMTERVIRDSLIKLWNSLPAELKTVPILASFKSCAEDALGFERS